MPVVQPKPIEEVFTRELKFQPTTKRQNMDEPDAPGIYV